MTGLEIALVLAAPAVGSFLALLHDRMPRGEDVVRAPSRCRACGRRLRWPELVPLVSWLVQGGRCRGCGAPIPHSLPLIEAAATGVALLALAAGRDAVEMAAGCLLGWTLIPLATIDFSHRYLPDSLNAALLAGGLLSAAALPWHGFGAALLGAGIGSGAFLAIRWGYFRLRRREGLGLGDVKLMAGLGAWLGPWSLPLLVVLASVGGLAALVVLSLRGRAALSGDAEAPMGTCLCAAAMAIWFGRLAGVA